MFDMAIGDEKVYKSLALWTQTTWKERGAARVAGNSFQGIAQEMLGGVAPGK